MGSPLVSLRDWEVEARRLVEARTPVGTWGYFASGAGDEVTLRRNEEAFGSHFLVPRVLVNVGDVTLTHSLLGHSTCVPFGVAPFAFQRLLHGDGEGGVAHAASKAGVPMAVSSFATTALEDVDDAGRAGGDGIRLMQIYAMEDRETTASLVRRAEICGSYRAIVLTVDRPVLGRRDSNMRASFDVPWGLHRDPNGLTQGGKRRVDAGESTSEPGTPADAATVTSDSHGSALNAAAISPSLTWDDVAWLRGITHLPIVLKGILAPADAELAVSAGVRAVWVSNHGGRQLDCCLSGLDALPAVVAAVRRAEARSPSHTRVEIYVDGGVRRGTDVVKALCLGADFVWLARPIAWGLAVKGAAGVTDVLTTLSEEVENAMALVGACQVSDLRPELVQSLTRGCDCAGTVAAGSSRDYAQAMSVPTTVRESVSGAAAARSRQPYDRSHDRSIDKVTRPHLAFATTAIVVALVVITLRRMQ